MKVTCGEHRRTLQLLAVERLLARGGMSSDERVRLEKEKERLEAELEMD